MGVEEEFRERVKWAICALFGRRTQFVNSLDTADSIQKFVEGSRFAITSRRLLVPAALVLLYAAVRSLTGGDESAPHLQVPRP